MSRTLFRNGHVIHPDGQRQENILVEGSPVFRTGKDLPVEEVTCVVDRVGLNDTDINLITYRKDKLMLRKYILLAFLTSLPLALVAQTDNQEFRATWTIVWEHMVPGAPAEENMARARTILDNHAKANMTSVLWQSRRAGAAYFNSSIEPWGAQAGYQNPGYDPLAYAVEQAHARGLELHAWFNVFMVQDPTTGEADRLAGRLAAAQAHPNWICRDGYGNPMPGNFAFSPGLDSVRSYLVDVAMEIVNNYDVDGLHLDYVRWNEYTTSSVTAALAKGGDQEELLFDGMITPAQLEALNAASDPDRYLYDVDHPYSATPPDSVGGGQFPTWEDYWRWSVTEFVRTLHDSIRAVKPWVRLSVAALGKYNWSGWQGYGTVFQDAALWFNADYIDQLTPMHYHWTTGGELVDVLGLWQPWIQDGIDQGRLYTVGPPSYVLESNKTWGRHGDIVESCRTVPWADGFQFFSYGSWGRYQYFDEAAATFFKGKSKVRATRLIVDATPATPALSIIRIDSLNYQLTVTPDAGQAGSHWYAIYRSEDAVLDTAADEIVDIRFGNGAYTFADAFTGTQDYNGQYTYGATALDRYWNESDLSNAVTTTDSIPSFAPVVVATSPAAGDTIPVGTPISLTFSKNIDKSTLWDALSLDPTVDLQDTLWSNHWALKGKQVTITFSQPLLYDTTYTLTVAPTLTDVNGVALDGNNDLVPGDAFTLTFRSEPLDVTGPVVLGTYPSGNTAADSIYYDEVITFFFNEHLDPASITDTTLVLTLGGSPVETHHNVTNVRQQTVLSLQPLESYFTRGADYELLLRRELTDSVGNPMAGDVSLSFAVSYLGKVAQVVIDNLMSTSAWATPDYSGSTVGIDEIKSTFTQSTGAYLPASPVQQRAAARLHYEWVDTSTTFLLREYLRYPPPWDVAFDTSYVLHCFVFGDGSNNSFRFCLDDGRGTTGSHEVSSWVTLDWYGWRLLEWDLSDPTTFGEWIGNGQWDNPTTLYFDSFQLTHEPGASAAVGDIYFSNLRVVKQGYFVTIAEAGQVLPDRFTLAQNYPNPFNAVTIIPFHLPTQQKVELSIYNLLGRHVTTLISSELPPGDHEVTWQGDTATGSRAASGMYIYALRTADGYLTRRMILLK